eukprot:TRINITY_DN3339_c0_g1_i2.p1 TRINITY_DN3339_c0_g1~~TRINITY_DN3339_c0_g1_i2.p1  ORF type:complete len:395 (+),score=61.99 TRINITY_DN3339_c0_g1_i2:64-1248(+)
MCIRDRSKLLPHLRESVFLAAWNIIIDAVLNRDTYSIEKHLKEVEPLNKKALQWPEEEFIFEGENIVKEIEGKISEMTAPGKQINLQIYCSQCKTDVNVLSRKLAIVLLQVRNITKLQLGYSKIELNLDGCEAVAQIIEQTSLLTQFMFYGQNINICDFGLISLGHGLERASLLQFLHIELNPWIEAAFTDVGVIALLTSISTHHLQRLILNFADCGSLTNAFIQSISVLLRNNCGLKDIQLWLGQVRVEDSGIITLADALQVLTNLTSLALDLSRNELISDRAGAYLTAKLSNFSLEGQLYLCLEECPHIGDETISDLFTSPISTQTLTLEFSETAITDEGMVSLASNLRNLSLTTFNLNARGADLSDNSIETLVKTLTFHTKLQEINLTIDK